MDIASRSDSYLIKTYCHLVNNVVPQNEKNMQDFPPAEIWHGVRQGINEGINIVSEELAKRGINATSLDCSVVKI